MFIQNFSRIVIILILILQIIDGNNPNIQANKNKTNHNISNTIIHASSSDAGNVESVNRNIENLLNNKKLT